MSKEVFKRLVRGNADLYPKFKITKKGGISKRTRNEKANGRKREGEKEKIFTRTCRVVPALLASTSRFSNSVASPEVGRPCCSHKETRSWTESSSRPVFAWDVYIELSMARYAVRVAPMHSTLLECANESNFSKPARQGCDCRVE